MGLFSVHQQMVDGGSRHPRRRLRHLARKVAWAGIPLWGGGRSICASRNARTRGREWCLGLLLALAAFGASAASPKRVLMVFREDSQVPATRMLEQAMRGKLQDPGADGIEIYTEYLDASRFADQTHYRLFREYLREKYSGRRPDVILTVLTPAFDVAGARPGELMPGVPAVFIAVNDRDLPGQSLGTRVTGIVARPDFAGTLEVIFRLQPDTRRIVVIGGMWAADGSGPTPQAERATRAFGDRAEFEFWTNRTVADLRSAVAALPAHSVVLYWGIFRDAADRAFFPAQALELLLENARVPAYVLLDSQMGSGAVGGSVVSYDRLGAWAGETARRILDGAATATPPITVLTNGAPLFDWRALRRWGISEARLPPGSVLRFHQPTFWNLYRWHILAVVGFCCLQTALIIGLLVNRTRRRQAEAAATLIADLSSKFVNLPTGEVDREIVGAERRICELLGLDLSALWQWSSEAPGSFTLTHLYRAQEGPPPPERMDASEYFPWCQQQLLAGRIVAVSSLEELPAEAARDRETWRHFGIKTSLTIPLSVGGGPPVGALSFNTLRAERDWPHALVKRLQLVAQIFTNALARKRADQALRESEERMTLAAEAARFGVWGWNIARNQVWGSERWLRLFGFASGEDVSFEKVIQRIHPDDRATVEREVRRAVADRNDYAGEFRAVLPDGTQRWIASRGRGYPDASGKPARMLGAAIDITDRKRAEEAFRASEARLAAGADLAGLGYYEVDFGERACYVDDRFQDICGVPAGQQPGLQALEFWVEHLHPDDRQRVLDERQKLQDGRLDRLSIEYRYLHPAQGQKWIHHLAGVAMRNASGHAVHTFGVLREVTERKRLLERLQSAAKEWQATFDSISDMVMLLDPEYRIVRINAATVRFLGLPMERIVGSLCCPLMHGTRCTIATCPCQQTFQTKVRSELELFHEGSGKWLLLSTDPIQDASGNVIGAVHVGRDITEAKRAEAALHDLSRRLIRAHEEERARLARELHDDVTQRLARLAIDAGRVARGADEVSPAETMRSVRDGLVRLSEDIHALAYRLHPSVLEDLGLAEALKAECERFSRQESVSTDVTLRELPTVVPPETALCLFRVAQEALRNVARHAQARRVEVSVRALDGGLQLAVFDDGIGFDPALQRDRPSLGLASMRERVLLLDGELDIDSAPGQGATIVAWVPLKEGP